ncbi:hypothetical protein ACF0H5_017637 [Mactra antiquata]
METFHAEDDTRQETREQSIPTFMKPSNKKISRDVSRHLDGLGFSRTQIWNRIRGMNIRSTVRDIALKFSLNTNKERILIGSQREGIGLSGLSDIDVLQVEHDVICTKETSFEDDARLVVKIVDTNTPPGYCQLQVDKSAVDSRIFKKYQYATVQRFGNIYLSSKRFVITLEDDLLQASKFTMANTKFQPQHGPSTPRRVQYPTADSVLSSSINKHFITMDEQLDFVRALPCDGHIALNVWRTRPRKYDWPRESLIRHIMSLPTYVVPVGHKGSFNTDLEWRMSFVRAEIKLVQSLNNVQMKIFLLLKIVAKHYLNSESEIISSYVIKNIMFWLAEEIPQKKFRQKHLMARMIDALQMLKKSIMTKMLPTYMQPARNLFANKLGYGDKLLMIDRINYILCKGRMIIYRFLYTTGSRYPASAIQQIIDELKIGSQATQNELHDFADYSTKRRLHLSMIRLKLRSEKELIIATSMAVMMKNADHIDINIKNDQYCSRKLMELEKELRTATLIDMKPDLWEQLQIIALILCIRFLSILFWVSADYFSDISDMSNTSDHDTQQVITQSGREQHIKKQPLSTYILLLSLLPVTYLALIMSFDIFDFYWPFWIGEQPSQCLLQSVIMIVKFVLLHKIRYIFWYSLVRFIKEQALLIPYHLMAMCVVFLDLPFDSTEVFINTTFWNQSTKLSQTSLTV